MIVVENLSKHFGATLAVDSISFAIGKGEVVGFLGPNGAGKTTTIRVLTCYHPATAGRAAVAGHDVEKEPVQVRKNIGYLAENVPLYPDLRVEEFLTYRAALKGVPRRGRKAAVGAAMERCGVSEVRRKLVGHVSRGYRQRVGLADALVANPPILILDEPTSGLDPNQRRKVKDLVRELADEHTILFSSHILAEVEDVSSRVIVIDRGEIKADGAPEQLLEESEGRRLVVCAHATPDELRETLGDLGGVRRFEVEPAGAGFTTIRYFLEPGADPRDLAFERLRDRDVRLRELKLQLPTLEEYFTILTGAGGVESVADSAVDSAADSDADPAGGGLMGVILATFKKEMISYLFSPVAYIIAVVLYLGRGFDVFNHIALAINAQLDVDTFVSYYIVYGFTTNLFFVLVPPILTMRCFAEEKRTGSLEVLMTAPVRDFEIVVGKWVAAVVFFSLLWLPTIVLLFVLSSDAFLGQTPHFGPLFAGYLGLFLLGAMLISVGMFTSSLTDNTLLASMLAMIFNMALVAAPGLVHRDLGDGYYADVIREQTNVIEHLSSWFGRGQIDTSKVVFYVAGVLFFLFLTVRSLESRKWR